MSFIDGAAQAFVPTHLLTLAALGLMAGQNAQRLPGMTLAAFAFGLIAGSVLIALALRETPVTLVLLALAAICGIIVVLARPVPSVIKQALALATGTALALNAPPQAIAISSAVAAQFGTGIAALATLSLLALVAAKADRDWLRVGLRIVGSWIAASAVLVLALRLASLARHGT